MFRVACPMLYIVTSIFLFIPSVLLMAFKVFSYNTAIYSVLFLFLLYLLLHVVFCCVVHIILDIVCFVFSYLVSFSS